MEAQFSRLFIALLAGAVFFFSLLTFPVAASASASPPSFFQGITEWFKGLLGVHERVADNTAQVAAAGTQEDQFPNTLAPASATGATTTINQYVTNPVVERIIERAMPVALTGITQSYIDERLSALDERFSSQLAALSATLRGFSSSGVSPTTFAQAQRIDQLANVVITNATVSGVTGLSDADIPDTITASNYLPLSGGSVSGLLSLASTTVGAGGQSTGLTIFGGATTTGNAYFGGNISVGTSSLISDLLGSSHKGIRMLNDSGTSAIMLESYRNGSNHTKLWGFGARGTAASPLTIMAGDALLEINASGHNGTTFGNTARILLGADAAPSSGSFPGFMSFETTAVGGTDYTERMRITSTGKVGIGTASPTTMLTVIGTTTVGDFMTSAGPIIDVRAFGAVGDGVTNDTSAIVAAIAAAPSGGTVLFPPTVNGYRITSQLSITKPLTLMGRNTLITQATAGAKLFNVSSSGVRITGFILVGPQYAAYSANETAVYVSGTLNAGLAPSNISNISVDNNRISGWGSYGILLQYGTDFFIRDNSVSNVVYSGIGVGSGVRGTISGNTIDNVLGGAAGSPSNNAYGISVSRATSDAGELVSQPRSADITIVGNAIKNVPTWEGIDTHAGERVTISGNTIYNTLYGIMVGTANNSSGAAAYAPLDVTVNGNTVVSGVTDGSRGYGIVFQGVIGGERAMGSVTGNTVRDYGDQSNSATSAGMYVYATQGLVISGNTVINPAPHGINIYAENYGFSVTGNTVVDPWSNSLSALSGVHVYAGDNTGTISGNTISRASKSATYTISSLTSYAIRLEGYAGEAVEVGLNRSEAYNYLRDPLGVVSARFPKTAIGTSTPYSMLSVWGADTASTTIFSVVNSASTTVFSVFGNGNSTYAGSIFQSSDQRLKSGITSLDASNTLEAINALDPVSYTRLDQPDDGASLGFIAQAVASVFPGLVTKTAPTALTPDGTYTVNYVGLIAPLVKAVQALSDKVEAFADQFFTRELTFVRASGDELSVRKLCVGSTCVTETEFAAMLAAAGQSSVGVDQGNDGQESATDITPPTLTVSGANPAHLNVGDTYSDLGVSVTDNTDTNLAVSIFVDGNPLNPVVIDTSIAGEHVIDYVASDQAGNTATSTRTVIVE